MARHEMTALAVRYRLEAVLPPDPAKRSDVVSSADFVTNFGSIRVNDDVVGDVLAEVTLAAHGPDEPALIPIRAASNPWCGERPATRP